MIRPTASQLGTPAATPLPIIRWKSSRALLYKPHSPSTPGRTMYLSSSRYWISAECCSHSLPPRTCRLLLGPCTRLTTVWIAFDSINGGCTSVGPFGLSLMDVRSPHAVLAISPAARTLRIWYLMIALLFPSGSRPHGQGEADAARRGQLAVFDTLPVTGVERRLRVDGGLLGPEQQVAAHQRYGRLREADRPRHRRRQVVRQAQLAELQVGRVEDAHLIRVKGVVPVVLR